MDIENIKLLNKNNDQEAKMKNYFRNQNSNNGFPAIKFIEKPSFIFFNDYYSTFIAINMQYFKDHFLIDVIDVILGIMESYSICIKCYDAIGEENIKYFKQKIRGLVLNSPLFEKVSEMFDIKSEELTFKVIITSICGFFKKTFAVIAKFIAQIFSSPVSFAIFLGLYCVYTVLTKVDLQIEKCKNYSNVLKCIMTSIVDNPQRFLDSNVLLITVDERDFSCFMPTSFFRKDEGSIAQFHFFEDLKNAPRAKEIKNIKEIIQAFQKIQKIEDVDEIKKLRIALKEFIND